MQNLLQIFFNNLLKEFSWSNIKSSDPVKLDKQANLATLFCSPVSKRKDLMTLFSLLYRGVNVLLLTSDSVDKQVECRSVGPKGSWGKLLIPTSGTGGNPKIIIHSLEELLKSAKTTLDFYNVTKKDRWPLSLPINHIGGLQVALRCLLAGIPLEEKINSQTTLLSLVPAQLVKMISTGEDLVQMKKMKAILLGGGPLGRQQWEDAKMQELPLSPTYGLTEMGSQVAALTPQDFLSTNKYSLQVLPGKKVEIVKGCIVVSGVGRMMGLFQEGRAKFLSASRPVVTQDVGEFAEGRLLVKGRNDRVIISGGKKIDPFLVEEHFLKYPGVEEVALVGLPDHYWGERSSFRLCRRTRFRIRRNSCFFASTGEFLLSS